MMLLDWMIKGDYSKLKERVGHHGEWRHWTYEPAQKGKEPKEDVLIMYSNVITLPTLASPQPGNSPSEEVKGHWTPMGAEPMEQWMDGML